jgi:hypothetical protein
LACVDRLKLALKDDPWIDMKDVIADYRNQFSETEPPGEFGIMRRLNDHPEDWRPLIARARERDTQATRSKK